MDRLCTVLHILYTVIHNCSYIRYDCNTYNKQKQFLEKMKCDVGMMIDHDVAEKRIKTR